MKIFILCYFPVGALFVFRCLGIWLDTSKSKAMPFSPFLAKENYVLILMTRVVIITTVKLPSSDSSSRSLLFCLFVDVQTLRPNLPLVSRNQMTLIFSERQKVG